MTAKDVKLRVKPRQGIASGDGNPHESPRPFRQRFPSFDGNENDHVETERSDREIGALGSKRRQTDQETDGRGQQSAQNKRRPESEPQFEHEKGCCIRAQAEERAHGKIGLARIAHDQVEGQRCNRPDADENDYMHPVLVRDKNRQQHGCDDQEEYQESSSEKAFFHFFHQCDLVPNNPVGLKARKPIRMAKAISSL